MRWDESRASSDDPTVWRRGGAELLGALSGGLLVFGFPDSGSSWVAWIALVPLVFAIRRASLAGAFTASLLCFWVFQLSYFKWVVDAGIPSAYYVLGTGFVAACMGVAGAVAAALGRRVHAWSGLAFAAAWAVCEFLRLKLDWLSAPWGLLGYSQYEFLPAARVAAITGVHGVSFLIVAANVLVADIAEWSIARWTGRRLRTRVWAGLATGALCATLVSSGLILANADSRQEAGEIPVALVQAGRYSGENGSAEVRAIFDSYQALSREVLTERARLLVWPESAIHARIPHNVLATGALARFAQETETPLLVGTAGRDKMRAARGPEHANTAVLFSRDGSVLAHYDKNRLLPFNEFLPLRGIVKWPLFKDTPDAIPGRGHTVFKLGGTRFGVLICWENMFPEDFRALVAAGTDFMVSLTNEAFTEDPGAHEQLFAANVLRSIENGVSTVRAATTGISAVIAPDGRFQRISGPDGRFVGIQGSLLANVPLAGRPTPYSRFGDWFPGLLGVALLASGAASLWRGRESDD